MIAAAGRVADRTRVLKHGDTFAVFDRCGDITRGGLGEQGLYHHGTRHLSRFGLDLDGRPPFFLCSTGRDENHQLAVALTNSHACRAEELVVRATVACARGWSAARLLLFEDVRCESEDEVGRYRAWSCQLRTSNGQIDAWVDSAVSDLHMMTTALPTGPYPYAGVPWLNTPFGRDGIITVLECLWLRPGLARGVLGFLASTQATRLIPEEDAEPGKILHESRGGEMATLREVPFGRYYGSVDATPLFVLLAGAYYERTGDRDFVKTLWPNIEAALAWIDRHGDRDGDGFVEYQRQSSDGLLHQGWKDSDHAVFHADGSLAEGPIALCEVQGYVYAARRAAATIVLLLGRHERAAELTPQARAAPHRFGALALQIWTGQFEAGMYFDLHRVPELFCGFQQDPGEGPITYPVACAPQAWSAASVFLLFQACLGLTIDGPERRVYLTRPRLPASLDELRIHPLEVGDATVDLLLRRREDDVGVNVLRRDGDVQLMVVM